MRISLTLPHWMRLPTIAKPSVNIVLKRKYTVLASTQDKSAVVDYYDHHVKATSRCDAADMVMKDLCASETKHAAIGIISISDGWTEVEPSELRTS